MNLLTKILAFVVLTGSSVFAQAHRSWVLPAATVLSGDQPWVTVDAAVSNDIFHFNYVPLRIEALEVVGPEGEQVPLHNASSGKHRSTFDIQLMQPGTYKIASISLGLSARWETPEGERGFYPPRGQAYSEEGFAKAVPKDAKNLKVTRFSRRVESFVTSGAPSEKALAPNGKGLELVPLTHPNDLYNGETARFRLTMDGEPTAGVEVTVIPAGMRYRDSPQAIEQQTDDKGEITIDWPHAGLYWLNATYRDDNVEAPASERSGDYSLTLEVLPQ